MTNPFLPKLYLPYYRSNISYSLHETSSGWASSSLSQGAKTLDTKWAFCSIMFMNKILLRHKYAYLQGFWREKQESVLNGLLTLSSLIDVFSWISVLGYELYYIKKILLKRWKTKKIGTKTLKNNKRTGTSIRDTREVGCHTILHDGMSL